MNTESLCFVHAEESTNNGDENDDNSIEAPFHLYQFLSNTQCNIQTLCRICLTTDNKMMCPLYSTKDTSVLATMFTALTAIEINPGDGLPANICTSCRTQIVSSYKFKMQCEKATSILESVLKCFTKDESIVDNNNPEYVPESHNTNNAKIKQEVDILSSEGVNCLDDDNFNEKNEVFLQPNTVKRKKVPVFFPKVHNLNAIKTKEELDISKSEDVEFLDYVTCNENDALCMRPYTAKQKKRKVTISVTDSNTLLNEIVSEQISSKRSNRKTHSCKFCPKKFYKVKLLRAHLNNNHQLLEQAFSCIHCKDSYSSEHDLNLHLTLHSKGPTWRCNKCEKVFESKSLLRRHIYRHMESKRYSCETCGKLFTERYALRRHTRVHTGETVEKKHECHLCDKKYSEGGLLAAHIARHEGFRPCVCSVCGKSFPSPRLLGSHSLTHTDNKPYACSYCDKRFRHESTRNIHHRTHTGEKPYICSTCGKTFIQNSNLTLHMRTHTGEKPYSCSICKRKFSSGSSLKVHERTHTGERPYECKICGKRFARLNMRAHMLIHTGERPYACSMCPKKFVNATRLRDHSRVHTGEKPFECAICSQKFPIKSHLVRHMKTHAENTTENKSTKRFEGCSLEFVVSNEISDKKQNVELLRNEDASTEHDCRAIVFDIEEVPIEVSGELVLQGDSNLKTEMLVIDGGHNYQTENLLNANGVIVSDINYANNLVAVNEGDGSGATSRAVLEGTTVKLYQLDQSLLQIHSAGGQLTISKITSKMTANF